MVVQEDHVQSCESGTEDCKTTSISEAEKEESQETTSTPYEGADEEESSEICRVCQSAEPDRRGDAALVFLNIIPPIDADSQSVRENSSGHKDNTRNAHDGVGDPKDSQTEPTFRKFVSPEGEVIICSAGLKAGSYHYHDALINLGCSCKNDLALAHYACALKWFINHGSTVCEICGSIATNIRTADFHKVIFSLKECEILRERTAAGELTPVHMQSNPRPDPDAVAAIRLLRLTTEISLWFNPQNHFITLSQGTIDQASTIPAEETSSNVNRATKWAVESAGILVATGLLTITLAWLIAPRIGKKTARSGLHIFLGGLCALTIVVFLRFVCAVARRVILSNHNRQYGFNPPYA
ncbi:hypothetical protein EJ110_NYTH43902 [Nymphaea thermarum]|nr:hypothetical protein EJ110_NYTH43902 [Nymphaea thermarum]